MDDLYPPKDPSKVTLTVGKLERPWPEGRPPSIINPNSPACYARLKHGKKGPKGDGRCYRPAMWNGHTYTRCPSHGGRAGRKPKTGQQSMNAGRRIVELAYELENDEEMTSIEHQVKLGAALLLENLKAIEESGIEKLGEREIDKLMERVERLSRLIERRHKIREGNLYTVRTEHVVLVVHAVAEAINEELADFPELRERLAKRIGSIKVIEAKEPKRIAAAKNA